MGSQVWKTQINQPGKKCLRHKPPPTGAWNHSSGKKTEEIRVRSPHRASLVPSAFPCSQTGRCPQGGHGPLGNTQRPVQAPAHSQPIEEVSFSWREKKIPPIPPMLLGENRLKRKGCLARLFLGDCPEAGLGGGGGRPRKGEEEGVSVP